MNLPACALCRTHLGAGACFDCMKFREWLRSEGLLEADTRQHPEMIKVQLRASQDEALFEEYLREATSLL